MTVRIKKKHYGRTTAEQMGRTRANGYNCRDKFRNPHILGGSFQPCIYCDLRTKKGQNKENWTVIVYRLHCMDV